MTGIRIKYIPEECMFCDNVVIAIIEKRRIFGKTEVEVCKECAKKIWEEETNRRLP